MQDLVDLGVDGMFADFPNRLEDVLGEEAVDGNRAAIGSAETSRACLSGAGTEVPDTGGVPLLLPASLGVLHLSLDLLTVGLQRA